MPASPARASLASMVRVGLIGFGGGSALIPLMEDELVARRRVLDRATFGRHIVVASITPGALPVKLGGLAGITVGGAWLCLTMATLVSLPGTAATVGILSAVRSGGQGVIRYVELASVGIAVFIIALLVHYVGKVLTSEGSGWLVAAGIATLSFLATGASDAAEFIGHLLGQEWQPSVPGLTAVQLVASALVIITLRAALRRGHPARLPATGHDRGLGAAAVLRSTALLLGVAAGATAAAALFGGKEALAVIALVALSTLTSFGGGGGLRRRRRRVLRRRRSPERQRLLQPGRSRRQCAPGPDPGEDRGRRGLRSHRPDAGSDGRVCRCGCRRSGGHHRVYCRRRRRTRRLPRGPELPGRTRHRALHPSRDLRLADHDVALHVERGGSRLDPQRDPAVAHAVALGRRDRPGDVAPPPQGCARRRPDPPVRCRLARRDGGGLTPLAPHSDGC